jgi:DNA modification methylase
MAPEIALKAIPSAMDEPFTVLDPMCGSGTVLGVAIQQGHNAVGVDIDPLAVMMSQLTVTPLDSDVLTSTSSEVVRAAAASDGEPPWGDDDETNHFVDYWFGSKQKKDLIALTAAISSLDSREIQLGLRLALSRIIVTKTPAASLAADTSHSRPHRVQTDSDYDVLAGFARSTTQLARMLEIRTFGGSGRVELGDARSLSGVDDASVDLAVTSPPYLNALDYLRGHKLALVWFGYKIAELRARRSASIGAERRPDGKTTKTVSKIVDVIESEAANKEVLRRPMLERFAQDCIGFATELHRTVRSGGRCVLVVGNSTLKGNYIRNDVITQKAMEHAGFRMIDDARYEREIPPSSRYMAINASDTESSVTKRMRTEIVMTLERP